MTGTIIHGTLLTYDLIEAFVTELEDRSIGTDVVGIKELIGRANDICALGKEEVNYPDSEDADDYYQRTLEQLTDYLGEFAPDGFYFGAHEGDGSDFGYWPIEEDA